jgi:protein TonB
MTAHAWPQEILAGEEPLPRTVWLVGAVGALVLHTAVAGFAIHYLRDTTMDLGAPGMIVDVDLASPHRDPIDLPIGLDTTASAASPSVVEQKTIVEPTNLPKDAPTETDDPERVVTTNDEKNPDDKDPKITAVQAAPSNPSVAAEETAVPTVQNARELPRSTAPSLGTGTSSVRERVTWEKELAVHFDKFKRYPAERAMQAAQVVVSFVLDRDGHVVSSQVVRGSGDPAFDAAALAMLQRSDPVPPPPPVVADQGLSFTLPVIFHVKPQK